jgi:hypothetical protein
VENSQGQIVIDKIPPSLVLGSVQFKILAGNPHTRIAEFSYENYFPPFFFSTIFFSLCEEQKTQENFMKKFVGKNVTIQIHGKDPRTFSGILISEIDKKNYLIQESKVRKKKKFNKKINKKKGRKKFFSFVERRRKFFNFCSGRKFQSIFQ